MKILIAENLQFQGNFINFQQLCQVRRRKIFTEKIGKNIFLLTFTQLQLYQTLIGKISVSHAGFK